MDAKAELAADIMRRFKPRTLGDIFDIAKQIARTQPEHPGVACTDDCENGKAWAVVDAHTGNINSNAYRVAAGLS